MARDCKTAAALLSVIAGKDIVNDPSTASIPFETVPDYAKACTKHGLKGARLGESLLDIQLPPTSHGRAIPTTSPCVFSRCSHCFYRITTYTSSHTAGRQCVAGVQSEFRDNARSRRKRYRGNRVSSPPGLFGQSS